MTKYPKKFCEKETAEARTSTASGGKLGYRRNKLNYLAEILGIS
jgi:hypothetical protein